MRTLGLHLLAAALVARAALRVRRLAPALPFDTLVDTLRGVPAGVADPPLALAAARVAQRLLPLLPPHSHGPCLRRSLLLLDVWTRCGLAPRLHLGVRTPTRDAHAWLTSTPPLPAYHAASDPAGYPDVFVF